jgi:hypothetical protein
MNGALELELEVELEAGPLTVAELVRWIFGIFSLDVDAAADADDADYGGGDGEAVGINR